MIAIERCHVSDAAYRRDRASPWAAEGSFSSFCPGSALATASAAERSSRCGPRPASRADRPSPAGPRAARRRPPADGQRTGSRPARPRVGVRNRSDVCSVNSAHRVLVKATNQSGPAIVTPDVMFCSWSLQRQLSTGAQVGGCGTGEAEELEIGGDHLEQHVAPHLNCAAFVLGGS
jgi:hypothetical protein